MDNDEYEETIDYVFDSLTNGNKKQAKRIFNNLKPKQNMSDFIYAARGQGYAERKILDMVVKLFE